MFRLLPDVASRKHDLELTREDLAVKVSCIDNSHAIETVYHICIKGRERRPAV